jgi:hypothetical protein
MNGIRWTGAGLATAIATLLVACGGGSSGSSAALTSSLGSSGTPTATQAVTASGVITAFGSVFVNGNEFRVDNSTSVLDGDADDAASTPAALQVGMNVDVSANGGYASLVRFTSVVRGEVDAVDAANSTLTVLGQPVVVSSGTAFAGTRTSGTSTVAVAALGNISVGDYVVVYGYESCTGSTSTSSCTTDTTQVLASLVYEPPATGVYRAVGYASHVTTGSFVLNGLTVDYTTTGSGATLCSPTPCAIAEGAFVAVSSTTAPVSGATALTLSASVIRTTATAPVLESGTTVTLQGPVANLDVTTKTFTVRGVTVDAAALATTLATLSDTQIVQVAGSVTAANALTATAITVEGQATFSVMAPLSAASATADTLQVLGQTFTVNSATRFDDQSQGVRPFNLGNFATVLAVGDQLIVSGYAGSTGPIATRVSRIRTPATATVAVQGVVTADSATAGTVTVGGVTVTLGTATTLTFPGAGLTSTVAAFIAAITTGSTVITAEGTAGAAAGTLTATSAGLLAAHCGWATNGY